MRKSLLKLGKPNRHDALSLLGMQRVRAGAVCKLFTPEHTLQASRSTAGLAWNRWAGGPHTDFSGPQVASHFCFYHEPSASWLITNPRTTYLIWYRWHKARNMRNISQETLFVFQTQSEEKYQFNHTTVCFQLSSSISPLNIQKRWLSEASEMLNNLCLRLKFHILGIK